MNKIAAPLCLAAALGALLTPASAETAAAQVLPAMRFNADSLASGFYEQIQSAPQFQKISREAYGSPLELRVYHTWRINRGSAEATGLMSAATLGILPVVSSGDHAIVYEVLVNGVLVSSYKYGKSLTHAHSIWAGEDKSYGMGKGGMEWAKSTVAQFLTDAAADPKLAALTAEFDYYFAPQPTAVTPAGS